MQEKERGRERGNPEECGTRPDVFVPGKQGAGVKCS